MLDKIKEQAVIAANELCEQANLKPGNIVVIGCSSSEVLGHKVGSYSSPETALAIFEGLKSVFDSKGIYIAAQCCEHLNRAIIIERDGAKGLDEVNVIPMPKAGGSFATAAYNGFNNPVAVEFIRADAGLDIGGTLIGMHLKNVAVPIRLSINKIGDAILLAARTRPKFVGGSRAVYNQDLL